jgi:hypothetical protein
MFRENIPKDDQPVPAEGPDEEAHGLGAVEAPLVNLEILMIFLCLGKIFQNRRTH